MISIDIVFDYISFLKEISYDVLRNKFNLDSIKNFNKNYLTNMKTDIKDVIMSDDGSGNDIHIPIAMISLEDGNKIIKFLEKNKTSKIIVEINFSQKKESLFNFNQKFDPNENFF